MSDFLRVGTRFTVSGAAEVGIDMDLESETAVGLRMDEDAGSTVASLQIRNNAQTSVFAIHATADTENMMALTSVVTTGNAITITANSLTTGTALSVNSSATAITGAGRMLEVLHTGATSTSGILIEFDTDATDETVLLELDSASVSGNVLDINAASTTGVSVAIDGSAYTTGSALVITDNSADTGTRSVVKIVQDDAAATGATALEVQQDGDSYAIKISGATTKGIDLTACAAGEPALNFTDGNASTIDPSATAESGWLNIAVGGTLKYVPYYAAS